MHGARLTLDDLRSRDLGIILCSHARGKMSGPGSATSLENASQQSFVLPRATKAAEGDVDVAIGIQI